MLLVIDAIAAVDDTAAFDAIASTVAVESDTSDRRNVDILLANPTRQELVMLILFLLKPNNFLRCC